MSATEPVRLDVADGVATITLDSPHNRNALSKALVSGLATALQRAAGDDAARVVVITSADRVFCSGADLTEATSDGMEEGARAIVDLQRRIATLPKPVVVRVPGPVRAGGIGLVAAADVAVVADDASFALTEVRFGLAAAIISLTVLPRLTSRGAADVVLTGRTFGGAEAASLGLVTRSVPAEDLDVAVAAVVGDLLEGHPQGHAESKRILNAGLVAAIDAHGEEMARTSARLFASDAAREAMTAFLQRRR